MKTIAMIAAAVAVLSVSTAAIADQVISEQDMWDRVAKTMRPNLKPSPAPGNYDPPPRVVSSPVIVRVPRARPRTTTCQTNSGRGYVDTTCTSE